MRISDWSSDVCSSDLSPARDHDAGLPRGAKVGIHATLGESAGESKRRIFLAERAIRADRQQPLPAALAAGRDAQLRRRRADVDQPPPVAIGGLGQRRNIPKPTVHSAPDIEPRLPCPHHRRPPAPRDHAPFIVKPDDTRPRPPPPSPPRPPPP